MLALASFRILLYNVLDVNNAWLHIVGGIAFGLGAPIVMVWVLNRLNITWLFVAPRIPNRDDKINQPIVQAGD